MMNEMYTRKKIFNVCPLCGKKPVVKSKMFYDELVAKYGSACLTMECLDCALTITVYSNEKKVSYNKLVKELAEKWNRLRGEKSEKICTSA